MLGRSKKCVGEMKEVYSTNSGGVLVQFVMNEVYSRKRAYHDLERFSNVTHISAYRLAKLVSLMAFSNTNSIIFSSSALEPTDTSHI